MPQPRVIIPGFPSVRSMAMRWHARARLAFETSRNYIIVKFANTMKHVSLVYPLNDAKGRELVSTEAVLLVFPLSPTIVLFF